MSLHAGNVANAKLAINAARPTWARVNRSSRSSGSLIRTLMQHQVGRRSGPVRRIDRPPRGLSGRSPTTDRTTTALASSVPARKHDGIVNAAARSERPWRLAPRSRRLTSNPRPTGQSPAPALVDAPPATPRCSPITYGSQGPSASGTARLNVVLRRYNRQCLLLHIDESNAE